MAIAHTEIPMKVRQPASAMEDASQGARRATEEASSIAPPPDPEVAAVKALVEHGSQVNVPNQLGKTPLVMSLGHPEIGAYLKAHGASGEIPTALPSLSEQRKQPSYDGVLLALFSGRSDTPPWLITYGYSGNEALSRVVTIGGAKYEFYNLCEPHNCGNNFLYVLFAPGGGVAWALTIENQGNLRFYGNPDQGLQAFLTSEYHTLCAQIQCTP